MNIVVVEPPRTTGLTTLARVRRELGLSDTSQDERLTDLINEVSADVVAYVRQPLIRQTVIERQVGTGRTVQVLSLTPVPHGGVSAVRFDGVSVSGWYVSDPDSGFLFYQNRWADTRQWNQWIERDPAVMPGNQDYEFEYTGGYILPGDDISPSGVTAANAIDSSFELVGTDTTFPILVSGEYVRVTGFALPSNNGRFKVVRRELQKLYVEATLVDEQPSGVVNFVSRNLPFDIEGAAVMEIKARYLSQRRDPSIKSESIGDWSTSYGNTLGTGNAGSTGGLNEATAGRLDKYMRLD